MQGYIAQPFGIWNWSRFIFNLITLRHSSGMFLQNYDSTLLKPFHKLDRKMRRKLGIFARENDNTKLSKKKGAFNKEFLIREGHFYIHLYVRFISRNGATVFYRSMKRHQLSTFYHQSQYDFAMRKRNGLPLLKNGRHHFYQLFPRIPFFFKIHDRLLKTKK